ncbi:hypothetical protein PFISCL1PPCAC_27766 [Pristionchus fissidentatus]|uniref:Uncharacterized protein n=1 Tax=Pristionchus fissidentatus TaxID=1538716 RepID=A0AAV5WX34_9BILA|nr:hypothetical protein PFISCL1PPCAC_27766 [Pristionchus fissidentatus]
MRVGWLLAVLLPLLPLSNSIAVFDRIKSLFKCRAFSMDYKYDNTPCPSRCQFLYTQCLDESQLFSGCVCRPGYVFDHDLARCITVQECAALEGSDHAFIVDQIQNKRRGFNISCDFQNYCDLSNITRSGSKIVDSSPIPSCQVDDQTIYWRGDQSSDVFYKGTTAVDCMKLNEKKQMFAMSLRRIWEADYKDEDY